MEEGRKRVFGLGYNFLFAAERKRKMIKENEQQKQSYIQQTHAWVDQTHATISLQWSFCFTIRVLNLVLSISMAYNVISCRKVAENTQILKITKFAM